MKLLFEIDKKDYDPNGEAFVRPSARGIIFRDGKIAVIYSKKIKYCKFPGGGIEPGEDKIVALIREVREEVGLTVKPETVKEFGYVHRIQKGRHEAVFIQDNYYYTCEVEDGQEDAQFTANEKAEDFVPMFMPIEEAIAINASYEHYDDMHDVMAERELRVLQIIAEQIKGGQA